MKDSHNQNNKGTWFRIAPSDGSYADSGGIHTTAGMLTTAAIIGVGYGMSVPSIQTLAIQLSPPHRIIFSCLDGGIGLGAYLLGAFMPLDIWPYIWVMGALTFCCIVPYYVMYVRKGTR